MPSCSGGSTFVFPPQLVYSLGGSVGSHPVSGPIETGALRWARYSIEVRNRTAQARAQPIVRFAHDGVTWGSWAVLHASLRVTDGLFHEAAWIDMAALSQSPLTYAQFGVELSNSSGSVYEMAVVALKITARPD